MRMAGPDIVLFVAGFVLFAGASYALVNQEGGLGALTGDSSALGVFEVSYPLQTIEVGSQNVADLSGTREVPFEVRQTDVTKVLVTVACGNDPAGAAAAFNLVVSVAGPGGLSGEGSGRCGTPVEVAVEVSPVPPATTVQGNTEEEAHENLGEHPNATKAQGTWTVTVSGARNAGPVGVPAGNPGGAVTLSVERWEHAFTPVQR